MMMPSCRCFCFTHPEWHFITSCSSTNYYVYAIIVHADFAQWTDFDAIWSARRMGTVLPTPVTDLCAEAVHRSGNVEFSLLNSRPKRNKMGSHQTHCKPERDKPDRITQQAMEQKKRNLRPIWNRRGPPARCTPLQNTAAQPETRFSPRSKHDTPVRGGLKTVQKVGSQDQHRCRIAMSLSKTAWEARTGALEGNMRCLSDMNKFDLNHR